jgi:hypothetical protein
MEKYKPDSVVGDVPPGLEELAKLPELAVHKVKSIGNIVVSSLNDVVTATSYDLNSAGPLGNR